jgi:hypothetical protein
MFAETGRISQWFPLQSSHTFFILPSVLSNKQYIGRVPGTQEALNVHLLMS